MSQPKILYTEPIRLVFIRNVCSYCDKVNKGIEYANFQLGILTCDDHRYLAKRDVRAYLHRSGKVKYHDAILDPLFTSTDLLTMDINVRRSSGIIETSWKLAKPSYDNRCHVTMDNSGAWHMIASFNNDEIIRGVRITDFKMVLAVEQHGLVDAFLKRLHDNMYKADQMAYEEAVIAAESAENPDNNVANVNPLPIVAVNHPVMGLGRILLPPDSAPVHVTVDPTQ